MAIRGPRLRIVRRLGANLPGLTRKSAERRPHPPGAHGAASARRRVSDFRRGLEEKQKARFNYGVSERQMRRYLELARALPGETGVNLLALLERRLDNVVFRLGLAPTIPAARQAVGHGHIQVNGRRLDRPGYLVRAGDAIALGAAARLRPSLLARAAEPPAVRLPGYLARDPGDALAGRVVGAPGRGDIPFAVSEALIIEHYAR
jgi:small subunit ribosomal protein S4